MDILQTLVIAVLVLITVYPFVIYPAVLSMWAKRCPAGQVRAPDELPTVALIICALNEEGIIREKIKNSLQLRYPTNKLTIVIVSDGSTDRTPAIVSEYVASGVVFLDRKVRRGKIANLNEVIQSRTEEIVVLSDANVLYDADAIGHLVARFGDPSVGCVSGKVVLIDTTQDLRGSTDQYYSLEWRLQEDSSRVYSMIGADGAMYALRRDLFQPCPADTLIEDLVVPISVIAQGKRTVLEPRALGWERGVANLKEEFRRKVRIAAGVAQGLIRGNAWPSHAPLRYWFIFISHKLLRWCSPIAGMLALAAALVWANRALAQLVITGTIAMCLLALVRVITGWKHIVFDGPFYFLFGQAAITIGLLKGLAGRQSVMWAKADR